MSYDQNTVRTVLDRVREDGRTALTAEEARSVCAAYGITMPGEGLARSADEAAGLARDLGLPVVLKIASPDILHKTDAGGVSSGLDSDDAVSHGYERDRRQRAGVQRRREHRWASRCSRCCPAAHEVIVGAVTRSQLRQAGRGRARRRAGRGDAGRHLPAGAGRRRRGAVDVRRPARRRGPARRARAARARTCDGAGRLWSRACRNWLPTSRRSTNWT